MSSSNQGRDLDGILTSVRFGDIKAAAGAAWGEVRNHGVNASCECPALEMLALLYERGYRFIPPPLDQPVQEAP